VGIKKWVLPVVEPELIDCISGETGVPPLPCAILYARGYRSAVDVAAMLGEEGALWDPYLLTDMDKAVERIRRALDGGEKIAVYGDYDCDGVTSTALLTSYLQSVGADVIYYIPDRVKEGYGLNKAAVDILHEQGIDLIVTVDNGISAHEEIDYASHLGIQVVVTDHHTPRDTLPAAVAVVNPHRTDSPYPFRHLAGVGVAFKLICALEEDDGRELLEYYSDLVMLGTVADVVCLTGENRNIVRHGLERLSDTERPGLAALLEVCGLTGARLGSESVAFGVIPRLNAAGRMGCVDDVVELLLTDDVSYAAELAASINAQNCQRKKTENDMMAEIEGILLKNPQLLRHRILVISGEGWHHGVVGIVAAKVMERYGKPTLLLSLEGGTARGSGRSLEGFSLIQAISACAEHLTQYGGHTLAAGLTLPTVWLEDFTARLQAYAAGCHTMPVPVYKVDCVLEPRYLKVGALKSLSLLEPFGQGNHTPLFLLQNRRIEGIYPTADKKHLRIRLSEGAESLYAIYFRMCEGRFPYKAGDRVDVLANISVGEYNGKPQLSVKVQDLRLAGIPQDKILEERSWYLCYQNGELRCPREELLPQRGDFAAVYKYIRSAGGFAYGATELYYRLGAQEMGYAKMCIALDVLEEMGLISRGGYGEESGIQLIPATEKVDMERSKILIGLRV